MSRSWRQITLTVILLLAVLAQGLMPAGFMPGQRDGSASVVICTATGPATVKLGPEFNPLAGKNDHKASDIPSCPFAPVLAQDSPVPAPSYGPALNAIRFLFVPSSERVAVTTILRAYLAQGPPALFA